MWFRFADPWLLVLLILPVAVLLVRPRRGGAAFPGFAIASAVLRESRGPALLRAIVALGLAGLALAAARPQYGRTIVEREQAGRDLLLVIDLSGSMRADDLVKADGSRADRLDAVFSAARDFVKRRPDDRIGLVLFAQRALLSCPLTYDHGTVVEFLERSERQQRALWQRDASLLGDGTNLGLGLGVALKALRNPNHKGKAVILITDGADTRNMPGWVDPVQAARQAASLDTTVYGIGVGDPDGTVTQRDLFGRVNLNRTPRNLMPDMGRLEEIVKPAKGRAFAADDRATLADVLRQIDQLEPTPVTVRARDDFTDRFHWPLIAGAALIALALLMQTRWRGSV